MEPSNKTAATQTEAEQRCDIVSAATALPELHSQTAANSCSVAPRTSDEPNGDSEEGESDEELDEELDEESDEESNEEADEEFDSDHFNEEFVRGGPIDDQFDDTLFDEGFEEAEYIDADLYWTLRGFRDRAHRLIAAHLLKAADHPQLDELPQLLRTLIEDRSGLEIVAVFQDAESLLGCTGLNAGLKGKMSTETMERVGAALAELFWSEQAVTMMRQDWYHVKYIYAVKLKALHKLATAYKKGQNEGRIKKSADRKRKASPAIDGPAVQRPRNA
ncbi:hypothetical protein HDK64DRAFT_304307 [Phyllosticta capitalensis]